jgi:hypothetical protein
VKVEGTCPNNTCPSVVNWGKPPLFRHWMLAQREDPICPLCMAELMIQRVVSASNLFPLGNVLVTSSAEKCLHETGMSAQTLLRRHVSGDWGTIDAHDWAVNERARTALPPNRARLLSKYPVGKGAIYIITEAGRHETTLFLPREY